MEMVGLRVSSGITPFSSRSACVLLVVRQQHPKNKIVEVHCLQRFLVISGCSAQVDEGPSVMICRHSSLSHHAGHDRAMEACFVEQAYVFASFKGILD